MNNQIHRAVHSAEHDPAQGRIHGFCLLCGVPYPCDYIGEPEQPKTIARNHEHCERLREVLQDLSRAAENTIPHPDHKHVVLSKHGWPCTTLDFCVFSNLKEHVARACDAIDGKVSV